MSRVSPTAENPPLGIPLRVLEQQLEELQNRARSASPAEFYSSLLETLTAAVQAVAAVVWKPEDGSSGQWMLQASWGARFQELVGDQSAWQRHLRQLPDRLSSAVSRDASSDLVILDTGNGESAVVGIPFDDRMAMAIEVFWDRPVPPAVRRTLGNVLQAFSEVAVDFQRHDSVRRLRQQLDEETLLDQFALNLQAFPTAKEIWYTATNEIARLVSADRVGLITAEGGWRVRSISHVDTPDRRSPIVRSMERLATMIGQDPHPHWLHNTHEAGVSEREPHWQRYLEESAARSAALIPLTNQASSTADEPTCVLGALLIERLIEVPFSQAEQRQILRLARHTSAALTRLDRQRASRLASKMRKWWVLGMAALAAVLLAIAWTPVEFRIAARGQLQPVVRQDVFAPTDGVVSKLLVHDGQSVAKGDALLELTNDDLEFQLTKINGELHTARQQQLSIQAARLESAPGTPARDREQRSQLAAEEERLKQVVQNLEAQHQQLLARQEKLTVRSPIAGKVVTADIEHTLRSRPLRRGQRLMRIADEEQSWMLELWVQDGDVGHLLDARQKQAALPLQFILGTDPASARPAVIESVSEWTEFDDEGMPAVRVTARVPDAEDVALRSGASVSAKIHCGTKRLGYVWFRDLIELVRTKMWF